MKFKIKTRGYSVKEVDEYLADLELKNNNLRIAQKQRIDELSDENYALRRQVQGYANNEHAIVQSLVDANHLAEELQGNAQKFADVTLERAKTFYVAWSAYAKTFIAALSDEEVKRFNELKEKVEHTIDAYEGASVAAYAAEITAKMEADEQAANGADALDNSVEVTAPEDVAVAQVSTVDESAGAEDVADNAENASTQLEVAAQIKPLTAATDAPTNAQKRAVERLTNPIDKVQKASGQAIDLRELVRPTESLADLCRDLGFDVDETADK